MFNLKLKICLVVLLFQTLTIFSKNVDIIDSTILNRSDKLHTYFTHPNLLLNFSISFLKFKNGDHGISLHFRCQQTSKVVSVKEESITFHFEEEKKYLNLSRQYRDTSFIAERGGISQIIIFKLAEVEYEAFLSKTLNEIEFTLDENPYKHNLNKNISMKINRMATSTR